MKIRTSLVSNSSVSSFILYGIRLTKDDYDRLNGEDDEIDEWAEEHDLEYHKYHNADEYSVDEFGVIGKNINSWEYGINSMSESEWSTRMDKAQQEMAKLGIDGEYRIFMGMVDG